MAVVLGGIGSFPDQVKATHADARDQYYSTVLTFFFSRAPK